MKFGQFWQLVFTKVRFNLQSEASESYLSYLWWVLEPALFVGALYFVFGVFMKANTPNFVGFLCCGLIPFTWFSHTVSNACTAISDGQGLMNQVHITKVFFPIVVILQDLFKTMIIYILLLLFVALSGNSPSIAWLAIPILVVVQLVFVSALAIFSAMVVPFLPDLRFLIGTGITLMMFGSGIFYDYAEVIIPEHRGLFLLNPMANLIRMYREVLLGGAWPEWDSLFWIFLLSVIGLALVLFILRKLDSVYPRLVLE
jgi:lipopolysaccharide transport system permease protein